MKKLIFLTATAIFLISCAPRYLLKITDETVYYERNGQLTKFDSLQIVKGSDWLREKQKMMTEAETARIHAQAKMIEQGISGYVQGIIINTSGHPIKIRMGQEKTIRLNPQQSIEMTIPIGRNVFVIDHLDALGKIARTETVDWQADNKRNEVAFGEKLYDWIFWIR